MKGGTQAAVAIGVGYVLGRRRRMRTATLLVAATAAGGMGGIGGIALRRGVQMLGSTELLSKVAPQLGDIADTVRGDLLDAGQAAATAALSNRLESLTGSLHDRARAIRDPAAAAGEAGETGGRAVGTARRTADDSVRRTTGRRGRRAEEEPGEAEDLAEDEDVQPADDEELEPADDEDADEEPDEQPRRRSRRSAPVARTRR